MSRLTWFKAWWKRFLACFGFGSLSMKVELEKVVHSRGSQVCGVLHVRGGAVEQRIITLKVTLTEFWGQGKSATTRTVSTYQPVANRLVEPGSRQEFSFTFPLPDHARLSIGFGDSWTAGYRINADVCIQGAAVYPSADEIVEVVVHHEVKAVYDAFKTLGFEQVSDIKSMAEPPDNRTVQYFRTPFGLRDQLDGAALELGIVGKMVVGRCVLNRAEKTIGDHLKALIGGDNEPHPLQIPRAELVTASGLPNPNGARTPLKQVLNESLILPDNESFRLLRPASAPDSASERLLRPASSSGKVESDHLLRPAMHEKDSVEQQVKLPALNEQPPISLFTFRRVG